MTTSDVARSQRVLDKIGGKLGLTEAGKEWLIAAVDPWHDTPLNVCGYPDTNEAASVVQVVKVSAPIIAPTAAGSGNWDCHIHQFPWLTGSILGPGNFASTTNGNQITGQGALLIGGSVVTPTPEASGTGLFAGLAVDSVASGTPTFTYATSGTSQQPIKTALKPYLVGEYRIIGMGFEVINTTSELNVQGLCTVYRQPCMNSENAKSVPVLDATAVSSTHTFSGGYLDLLQTNSPPATTAEALLLDGSKQWKAKEGCYVAATMNSSENPAGINNTTPVLHLSASDPTLSGGVAWGLLLPETNPGGAFTSFTIPAGSSGATNYTFGFLPTGGANVIPFNHSGVIFTGLSNSTTLQVNAIYYIERFPSQQDSDLVVLARQSCHADHIALELYSEIVKEMPVGVPQRMNGMGEWFADAVSSAADFISPVLSAIPLPMAQTVGAGIKMAGGLAKSLGSKKEAPGQTFNPQGKNVSGKGASMPTAKPADKKKKKG